MSARLFVAVDLTEAARRQVAEATSRLRRSLDGAGMDDAFRWVATENLHLTLRFLGDVDDEAVPDVVASMAGPIACTADRIAFGSPATFPGSGRPRVLHVGVPAGAPVLAALRDFVDARLSRVWTWDPETRPFAPHLTLARARDRAALDVAAFRAVLESVQWPDVAMDVTHATLFRSITRPSGPEYSVLARAALRS